jgi:hypothetical protein
VGRPFVWASAAVCTQVVRFSLPSIDPLFDFLCRAAGVPVASASHESHALGSAVGQHGDATSKPRSVDPNFNSGSTAKAMEAWFLSPMRWGLSGLFGRA